MGLKHFFVIILMFSIFLITGCSNNVDKGTEDIDNEFPPSYTGLIIINGTEYQMEKGGYKWERKKVLGTEVVQTDHASPNQMAEHMESISTIPNQKVYIKIEGNPDIKVYLWNEKGLEKEIEQKANQIIVPSSKGKYIYEVLAEWTNGTISYTFVVEVQ
ncbi:hypothetical protein [Lysinibacillus sp. fls2-241-R2A-57]|uniref:hypothetical protein n=1 Tax=Lysinibacillus sp. fls2-241-R2A-57 TaxID=3040292 RepID=UPI00255659FE|nr:hypothetical protein [Lysinibacillus sp. fls2-241-R2A-57]